MLYRIYLCCTVYDFVKLHIAVLYHGCVVPDMAVFYHLWMSFVAYGCVVSRMAMIYRIHM